MEGGPVKFGLVGVVVCLVGVSAGCGTGEVTVHTQGAQQVAMQVPGYCSIDYRTLITANEAYWAMNMGYTQDQSELVDAGLLRDVMDDFELTIVGNSYAAVGVRECAAFEPDESSFDPEPESSSEPSSCEADLYALEVAWEAYSADHGAPPASEADLVEAGFLNHESLGFDLVGTEIIAVPGVCD
jgi:hypothetical protein